MADLKPLHEILSALNDAGHTELWLYSARGKICFEEYPAEQDKWYLPKIITRDGRTVASREKRPNGWLLCGDWKNNQCRIGAAAPVDATPLESDFKFNLTLTD
ncbi:hypothetical protein DP804_23090 [Salmonella enterica subsp. enterica]|nr:hypothetical protein [Salmonella enterica subsp. enterica serovar Virchow]